MEIRDKNPKNYNSKHAAASINCTNSLAAQNGDDCQAGEAECAENLRSKAFGAESEPARA
jgi:hypothetical protein